MCVCSPKITLSNPPAWSATASSGFKLKLLLSAGFREPGLEAAAEAGVVGVPAKPSAVSGRAVAL